MMSEKQWFDNGAVLPDGEKTASLYVKGKEWQIYTTYEGGYALAVTENLYNRWILRDLLEEGLMLEAGSYYVISVPPGELISSVEYGPFGQSSYEANAFAAALKGTIARTTDSLADGIYIRRFQMILPTYQSKKMLSPDQILGRWFCGGMNILFTDTKRIRQYVPWLGETTRRRILNLFSMEEGKGGDQQILTLPDPIDYSPQEVKSGGTDQPAPMRKERKAGPFVLHGRTELEKYFREEILDIIDREDEYRRFGVGFPGPTLLYGPSGSGKTFAVEKLADYLGWPVFRINSGTVGSKYIHETGKKISQIFDAAIREAPSILIIDELEAFLSSRERGSGNVQAHLEEVGEFLRRIPDAAQNRVLLFGMTNLPDVIDKALMRKGRFDHVIRVGMPSAKEVLAVLESSLDGLPTEKDLKTDRIADMLEGMPLSDAVFVVKEAGRRCVRDGRNRICYEDLAEAAGSVNGKTKKRHPFGFS